VEGREIELIEQLVSEENPTPVDVHTYSHYGAFGHLRWSVDATGNDTVYSVDDYGRVVGIDDPDSEERTFKYNGFDELVRSRDPATGLWTTNVRDPLGRIERSYTGASDDPVEDVLYTWDTTSDPSRGRDLIGAVHSSRRLAYGALESEHFSFFDEFGRPSADDVVVEGTRLTMDYGYDSLSRIREITYPDPGDGNRYRARYEYQPTERGGVLRLIVGALDDQTETLLAVEQRDLSGRILQEVTGNNLVTRRTYDAMGRLSTLNVRPTGTGATVLDLRYGYDADGNITRRSDLSPDSWTLPGLARSELYELDSLDRLTNWRLCGAPGGDLAACSGTAGVRSELDYDDGGTLTEVRSKTGGSETSETFEFEPDRPHVPSAYDRTGEGLVVLHHDDAGRRIEDGARTIEYTSFDLPRSVSEGGGTLERYSYGPSGDRVRRIDKDGNSVFYHGDAFELRTNASGTVELGIAHIPGPGGVVASVVMQPDKSVVPIYHHRDALGSAAVTTANAGAVIERPYRDPFGGEVNRSGAPDSNFGTDFVDEGFTGHSLDRGTGYIDAEGRMYDPRTRRFLTTDPLAGIGGSQSWDPFSYVRNNPSTLIDPSGFASQHVDGSQHMVQPDGGAGGGGGGGSVGGTGSARGSDAPVQIESTAPNHIVDDSSASGAPGFGEVVSFTSDLLQGAGAVAARDLRGLYDAAAADPVGFGVNAIAGMQSMGAEVLRQADADQEATNEYFGQRVVGTYPGHVFLEGALALFDPVITAAVDPTQENIGHVVTASALAFVGGRAPGLLRGALPSRGTLRGLGGAALDLLADHEGSALRGASRLVRRAPAIPGFQSLRFDWGHILARHSWLAPLARGTTHFPPFAGPATIRAAVRSGWAGARVVERQGPRLLLELPYAGGNASWLQAWVNLGTGTIETVYPYLGYVP